MRGHKFIVSGEPAVARNTVYASLESQGFKLKPINDWSADAERGSAVASIMLGSLAGKQGRHVKLRVTCQTAPEGMVITLEEGTSGASGGLLGASQAKKIYKEIYTIVGTAFQGAGVLISGNNL
ncbi:MAG: hypothetical protein LBM60_09190 [Clostridium sp.]|jgi:hypothetical protein|nr:hypothetical protein [Clostridium sp.]